MIECAIREVEVVVGFIGLVEEDAREPRSCQSAANSYVIMRSSASWNTAELKILWA